MHISKFELHNYKGYFAPSPIELVSGTNIIVGQNNAGKTALLEALSLNFTRNAKPHRSLQTIPTPDISLEPRSWADVSIFITGEELMSIHKNYFREFAIPVPSSDNLGDSGSRCKDA
jgi:AAA15 family ATPase/GTPase